MKQDMMIMILVAFFVGFFFKQITGSICGDRLFEGIENTSCTIPGYCESTEFKNKGRYKGRHKDRECDGACSGSGSCCSSWGDRFVCKGDKWTIQHDNPCLSSYEGGGGSGAKDWPCRYKLDKNRLAAKFTKAHADWQTKETDCFDKNRLECDMELGNGCTYKNGHCHYENDEPSIKESDLNSCGRCKESGKAWLSKENNGTDQCT